MAVVAVKEAPFLVTVQGVVGRIDIEHDTSRRPRVSTEEMRDKQSIERGRVGDNLLVTTARRRISRSQLQAVERVLTRQRFTPVTFSHSVLPRRVALAHHRSQ